MKIIKIAMPARRIEEESKKGWTVNEELLSTPNFGENSYLRLNLLKFDDYGNEEPVIIQGDEAEAGLHAMKVGDKDGHPIWTVFDVMAPRGFGPMLYDIAMRYVSSLNGYLVSTEYAQSLGYEARGFTTEDSQNIWDNYREKRDDVSFREGFGFQFNNLEEYEDH